MILIAKSCTFSGRDYSARTVRDFDLPACSTANPCAGDTTSGTTAVLLLYVCDDAPEILYSAVVALLTKYDARKCYIYVLRS